MKKNDRNWIKILKLTYLLKIREIYTYIKSYTDPEMSLELSEVKLKKKSKI